MTSRFRMVLRLTAAAAALAGLVLAVLRVGALAGVWTIGPERLLDTPSHLVLAQALIVLAWGVGFAVLGLMIVWRVGDRHEALVAALFLGVYTFWGGVRFVLGPPWQRPVLILVDGFTHAIGIRFTQLFPRPLSRREVAEFGPAWFRRTVSPILAALINPWIYWPAAILIETAGRTLPLGPGAYFAHVVVWLALAVAYLIVGYRRGGAEDRRRLFWILEGVVVFFTLELAWLVLWIVDVRGIAALDLAFWGRWLTVAEAWATLICFALAIFYTGAFHSGLILRKTAVLSAAGGVAVLIFITLETTVSEVLAGMMGVQSRSGAIVGGVVAALAFRPLADRMDRFARRLGAGGEARVRN